MIITVDIIFKNKDIAEKAKDLRNLCFRKDRRFRHTELGHQFRFTNMQAAVGIKQIKRMSKIIKKKRWAAEEYKVRLQDLDQIKVEGLKLEGLELNSKLI